MTAGGNDSGARSRLGLIRASILSVLATLALAAPAGAGAVTLQPGDLLVVDPGVPGVTLVDPVTGEQTPVTDPTINTGDDLLSGPVDLALDANGDILIADYDSAGVGGNGAIIKVDPATGQQTFVSNQDINTGDDLLVDPYGLLVDASGDIIVSDGLAGGGAGAIIRVDPATGQQSFVSNNDINTDPDYLNGPDEPALDDQGRILVPQYTGSLIRIDPVTGQQTLVSDNTISDSDLFTGPNSVDVFPNGQILVADSGAQAMTRVDPVTGQQSVISNNTVSTGTDYFGAPFGGIVAPSGRIVATDRDGADGDGAVIDVDPLTGQQTAISDNTISGPNLFVNPDSTVIVPGQTSPSTPVKCRGADATIEGTSARDVLTGTGARDVIAALGGNDVVRGLGGNDVVCGGAGNDREIGGGGRDTLVGQAGGDTLKGGPGRDRLIGGKGRDRLRGGPGRDRLRGGPGRDLQRQ